MHPILVTIGGFELPAYGVCVALGILAGTLVAGILARRCGLGADFVIDVVFWMVLSGFAAAKIAYSVLNWREGLRDPFSVLLSGGGGIFLAGALGGAVAVWLLCRRRGVAFAACADALAPGAALAHVFGRVGCFMSGCCYGRPTPQWLAWAGVKFPRLLDQDGHMVGSWPYLDQLKRGLVGQADTFSAPVYPVQLLAAAFNLAVFGVLLIVWKRRGGSGRVFVGYVALYCAGRFFLEFLRGDVDRGVWAGLSLAQWTCLALEIGVAVVYLLVRRKRRPG